MIELVVASRTDPEIARDYIPITQEYRDILNSLWLDVFRKAGIPDDSIVAATSMGPKTLGKKAPNTGILKEGKIADILCLEKDPLQDLTVLQDKSTIKMVVKDGKIVVKTGMIIE